MTTLFLVICIVAFLVWLARLLRRREVEKFRDVDAQMLSELRQQHPSEETPQTPTLPAAQAKTSFTPKELIEPSIPPATEAPNLTLASQAFDSRWRQMLQLLEDQLAEGFRVISPAPLAVFTEGYANSDLALSYLIVDKDFKPVLGVEFFDAGVTDAMSLVKDDLPVMRVQGTESAPSIRVKLKSLKAETVGVAKSAREQRCPKCSGSMSLKAPTSGKNAGRRYWLCNDYPRCRGTIAI